MTEAEIEQLIYDITFGKVYFKHKGKKYCFRTPTLQEKRKSINVYHSIMNAEKYQDWLREGGVENFLIFSNCWSRSTPSTIKQIEKQLDRAKMNLYVNRKNYAQVKNAREIIQGFKKRLEKIMNYKYSVQTNTLEYYANTIKSEYLISQCLTQNDKPVFLFKYDSRPEEYKPLTEKCVELRPDMDEIKTVARSNLWKGYWNIGKTSVFSKPVMQLSDEQKSLINYTMMYDNIMEHPEAPEEEVLADEDMLDGWIVYQKDKEKREKMEANTSQVHSGASEVFLMANNQSDLDTIYSMNDMEANSIIKAREKAVKEKGSVDMTDLPDVQRDINEQIMSSRRR